MNHGMKVEFGEGAGNFGEEIRGGFRYRGMRQRRGSRKPGLARYTHGPWPKSTRRPTPELTRPGSHRCSSQQWSRRVMPCLLPRPALFFFSFFLSRIKPFIEFHRNYKRRQAAEASWNLDGAWRDGMVKDGRTRALIVLLFVSLSGVRPPAGPAALEEAKRPGWGAWPAFLALSSFFLRRGRGRTATTQPTETEKGKGIILAAADSFHRPAPPPVSVSSCTCNVGLLLRLSRSPPTLHDTAGARSGLSRSSPAVPRSSPSAR
jgi:hypothetical protein